jgi:hypothetical protein
LIAEVRGRPDEHDRHVLWDLTPGSYDQHLEKLRAENAAHDPPPLTPQRLRELPRVVVGGGDADAQRWREQRLVGDELDEPLWVEHDLDEADPAWDTESPADDLDDQYWRDTEARFHAAG